MCDVSVSQCRKEGDSVDGDDVLGKRHIQVAWFLRGLLLSSVWMMYAYVCMVHV